MKTSKNKWQIYEREKQKILADDTVQTAAEYERRIRALAKKLKL